MSKICAVLLFFMRVLIITGCNMDKKSKEVKENVMPQRGELSLDSQIFLGNRLFSEKTCITCHDVNSTKIGPSVKEIMKVYKEKNGDIVAFLKGRSKPHSRHHGDSGSDYAGQY